MKVYTPRHMRKRYRRSAPDLAKKQAFRKVKMVSDRYIRQSASKLEGAATNGQYQQWCSWADRGGKRA